MNSKTTAGVILFPVFCIVFNSSFIFVDSALANADLRVAITCLREFFGDIDKNDFPGIDDSSNDGEYLGVFCLDKFAGYLNETISKKVEENNDWSDIKQCLKKKNRDYIFEKYCEAKSSIQSTQSEEAELLQQIKSGLESSGVNLSVKLRELLQRIPSSKAITPIRKFINGVCGSEEFTEFGELIDENDKTETLECLEECSGKFIKRVANVVANAKTETIESLKHKLEEKEKELLIPMEHIREENVANFLDNQENIKQKYRDQIAKLENLENKSPEDYSKRLHTLLKPLDIDLMTLLGLEYLYNYDEIYNNLDQVLTEEDKQLNNPTGNLDKNLSSAFFLYKACAVRGCGMKPSFSIPLYKIIEYHAKDQAPNPSLFSLSRVKAFAAQKFGYVSQPLYTKFFKALWAGGKDATDAIRV